MGFTRHWLVKHQMPQVTLLANQIGAHSHRETCWVKFQGPEQESGKTQWGSTFWISWMCLSLSLSCILRTIVHRGSWSTYEPTSAGMGILGLPAEPGTWTHRPCRLRKTATNSEAAAHKCRQLLPEPRTLLASLRCGLSVTHHSQSLGSPRHRAQSLTQLSHSEGRAGSMGRAPGPPAGTEVLIAVLLPSGLWEALQSKTILSCNHIPFFSWTQKLSFCSPQP